MTPTLPTILRSLLRSAPVRPTALLLALTVAVPATAETAAAPAAGQAETRKAPQVVRSVAPEHPADLRDQPANGEAEIECLIGSNGQILETRVVSASQPAFGEAALAAARKWEFKAGERDGQPVAMRVVIPFTFEMSLAAKIESFIRRPAFVEVQETIVPAEQLPVWPMPTNYRAPRYPKEILGSGKRGKAVVAIVINKEGKVINPKIVKSSHPEFDLPSLVAAASLEFVPQKLANNETIFVSMEIQYDFAPEGARPRQAKPEKAPTPAQKKKKAGTP